MRSRTKRPTRDQSFDELLSQTHAASVHSCPPRGRLLINRGLGASGRNPLQAFIELHTTVLLVAHRDPGQHLQIIALHHVEKNEMNHICAVKSNIQEKDTKQIIQTKLVGRGKDALEKTRKSDIINIRG